MAKPDLLAHLTARAAGQNGIGGDMPADEILEVSSAIAAVASAFETADRLPAPSSLLPPLP